LIYVAGGLIGLALIWVTMGLVFRWLQDLPLGPFRIRATGAELRESEQRAVAAQRRLARFWWTRLWPIPVVCVLVATLLLRAAKA
jgi:hypothetical protein